MEFDSIKKSAIFQSTRAWPKATLNKVRSSERFAVGAVMQKHPADSAARDMRIEQDHFQRMMRFLHTIQNQRLDDGPFTDPLQQAHARRIKRTLSRQILKSFSSVPPSDQHEQ